MRCTRVFNWLSNVFFSERTFNAILLFSAFALFSAIESPSLHLYHDLWTTIYKPVRSAVPVTTEKSWMSKKEKKKKGFASRRVKYNKVFRISWLRWLPVLQVPYTQSILQNYVDYKWPNSHLADCTRNCCRPSTINLLLPCKCNSRKMLFSVCRINKQIKW